VRKGGKEIGPGYLPESVLYSTRLFAENLKNDQPEGDGQKCGEDQTFYQAAGTGEGINFVQGADHGFKLVFIKIFQHIPAETSIEQSVFFYSTGCSWK
jgi:hypothetical protein